MGDRERNTTVRNNEIAELGIHMERIPHHQEPPPPYTPVDTVQSPVSNQPVIHQTIIVQQPLKDEPIYYTCPSCHKRTLTTVQFINSHKTHMLAGFLCGLTMWCFLCCVATIPYAFSTFKKADHYCSNCNYYLGSYSKL